jgi:hypothetical protein
MSLLRRIENNNNKTGQNKNQMSNNNQNNNRQSPFGNRRSSSSSFGSRSNNNDNDKDNTPPPDPNTYLTNTRTTVGREVVRFGLEGLGDPFYRVLGHEMNPDMGDLHKLANALEAGSEAVDELVSRLDTDWRSYNLTGAMLVFRFNEKVSKSIVKALPMPMLPKANNDDDDEDDETQDQPTTNTTRLRATDPSLTLNVLTRARSQVLLAEAPVVFGQEYLKRQIITDDPRLVALARATGCLPDV